MVGFEIGIDFQLQHMVLLSELCPRLCLALACGHPVHVSVINLMFENTLAVIRLPPSPYCKAISSDWRMQHQMGPFPK
jgi:hypothetical protein